MKKFYFTLLVLLTFSLIPFDTFAQPAPRVNYYYYDSGYRCYTALLPFPHKVCEWMYTPVAPHRIMPPPGHRPGPKPSRHGHPGPNHPPRR